jgi:protein-S-isoprenylcysteine O-methyltransferase Ste14
LSTTATAPVWPPSPPPAGRSNPEPAPARLAGAPGLADYCLDGAERVLLLALYGWLAARVCTAFWTGGGVVNLLLLASEGLLIFFLLIRRPSREVSRRPGEWLLALAATCTPLLATPAPTSLALLPPAVGAAFFLVGMAVQLFAKVVLGRSFGVVPAHRGLKTAGPYRLVRHPMYAGYLVTHLAFLALNPTLWNLAVYGFAFSLQIPRLLAEERLLSRDDSYRAYQARVRYRLIPGLF